MSVADRASALWAEFRQQWQASARLRFGAGLVVGILALYSMLEGADYVTLRHEQLKVLDGEFSRLRSLSKERDWPERAGDAAKLNAALASMAWSEADIGLTEAAFQDWLRTVPAKLGLTTRSLTLARLEESKPTFDGPKTPLGAAGPAGLAPPPGFTVLRARISFELQRAPLIAFLAECARSERSVVVERMVLRMQSQPQMAELDLRVLARASEVKR